ncbi:MAG: hypothetical protein J0M04_23720 [Verrucomicrobia bacterium]|nr:hypothetical protein [Verrucomicrobiota bacterium]
MKGRSEQHAHCSQRIKRGTEIKTNDGLTGWMVRVLGTEQIAEACKPGECK